MKKKATSKAKPAASAEPKEITLIVSIYPPKKGQRRVVISGAPEGEMPLIVEGLFPERHTLLDRAFADLLKRKPQIVKVSASAKSKSADDDNADDEEKETEAPQEATDQLVSDKAEESAEALKNISLPEIEGDTASTIESDEVGNDE